MQSIQVTIKDEVRDEIVAITLRLNARIGEVIQTLVEMFHLPRYTFLGEEIYYDLYPEAEDSQPLPQARTVGENGVQAGDVLRLVSPEGRRIWQQIQDLIDQIKDQIKDKIEDKVQDWIEEQLDKLRRTQGEKEKVRQLEEKYRQIAGRGGGGKSATKSAAKSGPKLTLFGAIAAIGGVAVVGAGLIGVVAVVLLLTGVIGGGGGSYNGNGYIPPSNNGGGGAAPEDPDPDRDELYSDYENEIGTDPFNPDTDGDGYTDGDEVNNIGSDPLDPNDPGSGGQDDPDPDGDGLNTDYENEIGTDPYNADTDGDGLWDGDELFYETDPFYWDTDGDEYSDGEEVHDIGSNPLDPYDPGRDDVGQPSDPFGESIYPLLEQGYTRFVILQVQNAPAEPVEIMAQRVYEGGGELLDHQIFEGTDPTPAMTELNSSEPEVVLLYAYDPATLKQYEGTLREGMAESGLEYAYFYAIFADGTGYEWYRP